MKKGNKIKKVFRYFSLLFIIALGLVSIIGTGGGGGGGGGGGDTGSGTTNPVMLNDDTNASPGGASIAFNSAGDAMAVWNSNNGSYFRKILYSVYTQATDTWSDEAELSTGNSNSDNVAVCSDGTDFMVVWANNNIYAREYTVSSGAWGTEATIDSGSPSAFSPHVASTGTGYCAAWSQRDSSFLRIYANVYNGSTWGTDATVGSATGSAFSPKVASNGTGYCVTWPRNDSGTYNNYASIYTGTWSAETALEAIAGYADYPQIASDGAGYCVTWDQNDGALESIYANIYTGTWGGATLIESGGAYDAYDPKIASDGTGYGVVWRQRPPGGGPYMVYGNKYDNATTSWGGDGTIDSGIGSCWDPDVASNGSGYGVTWRLYDSVNGTENVLANIYDGVDWGTETFLESGSGDASKPFIASDGTGYGVVWIQDDGSRNTVYANLNSGSGWGTESNLMQNQYHGTVAGDIRFAANNAGDVLAIWRQHDNDDVILYGCLYSGGAWGSTFPIVTGLYYYDVSSDGDDFMIVHNHFGRIYAVSYDAATGVLGTEEQISDNNAYYCRITSNGAGYCATWQQYDLTHYRTYVNLYNGSIWEPHAGLSPIDSGSGGVNSPQVASNGTGYCVIWNQDDGGGTEDVWARIYNGTIWGSVELIESDSNDVWYPEIASDGTGYCVTWEQNNNIYANVYEGSPLAWAGVNPVETGSGWVDAPQVASNGSSYGVTWHQWDGGAVSIYVNLYDGSWGTEMTIESGAGDARYPRGASNGTGYCVSWVQDDGTAYSAYANTFDGSTWGTEQALESGDTKVNYDWEKWISVVATQDTYTIGWLQEDTNDPLVDNAWAYSGLSD